MAKTKEDTLNKICKKHFHGFSENQWECIKDSFPYCELKYIAQEYADSETSRLQAINDKLEELVKYLKYLLKSHYPFFKSVKLNKLESELSALNASQPTKERK